MEKIKVPKEVSAVIFLYMVWMAVGPFATIGFWTVDRDFMHLPKLITYPVVLLMGLYLARRRLLLRDWFVIYLTLYSCVVVLSGMMRNPLDKAFYAHIFSLVLPVIAISFGYFSEKYYELHGAIERDGFKFGFLLCGVIGLYFFLNNAGLIPYFGVSSLIAFPILLAFSKGKYWMMLGFVVAAFFSGKRTVIIGFGVAIAIGLVISSKKRIGLIIVLLATILPILLIFENQVSSLSILRRLMELGDVNDIVSLDAASSGRVSDVVGAINSINENFYNWLIGKGAGATFFVDYAFSEDLWLTHYTHISPISYVFIGGIGLAIPIYIKLFSIFFYAIKTSKNFISILFIYYFVTSFVGAILLTDPFIWMLVGVLVCRKKHGNRERWGSRSSGPTGSILYN